MVAAVALAGRRARGDSSLMLALCRCCFLLPLEGPWHFPEIRWGVPGVLIPVVRGQEALYPTGSGGGLMLLSAPFSFPPSRIEGFTYARQLLLVPLHAEDLPLVLHGYSCV